MAKFSGVDGTYRWSKTVTTPGSNYGNGVAADLNTGNVILTGALGGPADFGGGLTPSGGVFLAAYGPHCWPDTARHHEPRPGR